MKTALLVKRVGVGMMATIALSIQPLQYGLLAGVGRALAVPCPINARCVPFPNEPIPPSPPPPNPTPTPPNPTPTPPNPTPTPPPTPSAVKYLLLLGIGDGTSEDNTYSGYFDSSTIPTGLPQFFQASDARASGGTPVTTLVPNAKWRSTTLTQQGTALASTISTQASDASKIILVGHSMGGLRGRQALQFNRGASGVNKVVGLVTLGTPNLGAPIIEKGPNAATLMGGVLGLILGSGSAYQYLTAAAGAFGARVLVNNTVGTPSGQDMRPGSDFLNTLNNPMTSATQLGSQVVTLQVRGGNNEIDSYAASGSLIADTTAQVRETRLNFARTSTVFSGILFAMAFWTLGATIPLALAYAAAALLLFNLPAFWRSNVVGNDKGDSIVPYDNQVIPNSAGGGRRFALDLLQATHTGKSGEYQMNGWAEYNQNELLQSQLRVLQNQTGVPVSP